MPPVKPIPQSISSLSDEDLADALQEHGVSLGPILPTTRKVYERKLFHLQTGMTASPSAGYAPVDDDDDDDDDVGHQGEADDDTPDEEVLLQQHQPRQRTTRSIRTDAYNERVETRNLSPRNVSPRRPLHSAGYDRNTSPRAPLPPASKLSSSSSQSSQVSEKSGGGLPLWVKLVAIVIVAVIVFLVVKNMEPATSEPDIEINV